MTKQPPLLANMSERCCFTNCSHSPALLPVSPRKYSLIPNHRITPICWQPPIQSKPYFPEHNHKLLKRSLSDFLKEMSHVLPKCAVSLAAGSISKPSVVGLQCVPPGALWLMGIDEGEKGNFFSQGGQGSLWWRCVIVLKTQRQWDSHLKIREHSHQKKMQITCMIYPTFFLISHASATFTTDFGIRDS